MNSDLNLDALKPFYDKDSESSLKYWISQNENLVLVAFPQEFELHFKGKLLVTVLGGGAVHCLGYKMPPDKEMAHEIYSPRGFSLLSMKTETFQKSKFKLEDKELQKLNLTKFQMTQIREVNTRHKRTWVKLQLLEKAWIDFLDRYLLQEDKISLFQRDTSLPQVQKLSSPYSDLEKVLDINTVSGNYIGKTRLFVSNEQWGSAVQSMKLAIERQVHPKLLAVGGKGVGKSTFLKFLVNQLLPDFGRVLFIDLDPGQAEFTIPGCVSCHIISTPLLGPNFSHLRKPEHSFYVGEVNMSNCRKRYLRCLQQLKEICTANEGFQDIPWVINTMGFNHGLGVSYLIKSIELFEPSTIVEIRSRSHRKNYDLDLNIGAIKQNLTKSNNLRYNLLQYDAQPESELVKDMRSKDLWGLPDARHLREIVLLAYFGKNIPSVVSETPYRVDWCNVGVQILHQDFPLSEMMRLLNMNLVALGLIDESQMMKSKEDTSLPSVIHSSEIVKVTDFAVICAIDMKEKCFYVITPLSIEQLEDVNCITVGSIALPRGLVINSALNTEHSSAPYLFEDKSSNLLNQPWQRSHKPRFEPTGSS